MEAIENTFLEDLERRYKAGAKTLVMDRSECEIVLMLLKQRQRIREGARTASKYIRNKFKS